MTKNLTSEKLLARVAGFFYLIIIVSALFSQVHVRSALIDYNDATQTATNILESELSFRLAFASELLTFSSDIVVASMLFLIMKALYPGLALLSLMFRVVMASILALNMLNHFSPLLVLDSSQYPAAFSQAQLETMVVLSLKSHSVGYRIGLVFFSISNLMLSIMFFRSRYIPRSISLLLGVGALSVLLGSIAIIIAPNISDQIFPWYFLPAFVGEVFFATWLLLMGIRIPENLQTQVPT